MSDNPSGKEALDKKLFWGAVGGMGGLAFAGTVWGIYYIATHDIAGAEPLVPDTDPEGGTAVEAQPVPETEAETIDAAEENAEPEASGAVIEEDGIDGEEESPADPLAERAEAVRSEVAADLGIENTDAINVEIAPDGTPLITVVDENGVVLANIVTIDSLNQAWFPPSVADQKYIVATLEGDTHPYGTARELTRLGVIEKNDVFYFTEHLSDDDKGFCYKNNQLLISNFDGTWTCHGPDCPPMPQAEEIAMLPEPHPAVAETVEPERPVAPEPEVLPEAVIVPPVDGPRIQVVRIDDPCTLPGVVCEAGAVAEPLYVEVAEFPDKASADAWLGAMTVRDPDTGEVLGVKNIYQEELPWNERYVIIDGKCYYIIFDKGEQVLRLATDSELRIVRGNADHALYLLDDRGRPIRLKGDDFDDWFEGDTEVLEPVAAVGMIPHPDGSYSLEPVDSVTERTVYDIWFEQTGMTPEEYVHYLDASALPEAFFDPNTTIAERAQALVQRAEAMGYSLNPIAAQNLAQAISEEMERGMSAEGSLRDVVERTARIKVERVQDAIATLKPRVE